MFTQFFAVYFYNTQYIIICLYYTVCSTVCVILLVGSVMALDSQGWNMPVGAVAAYLAVRGRSLGPWRAPVQP